MSWSGIRILRRVERMTPYFTTPSGHIGGSATIGGADLAGGVTFLAATGDYGAYDSGGTSILRRNTRPLRPTWSPSAGRRLRSAEAVRTTLMGARRPGATAPAAGRRAAAAAASVPTRASPPIKTAWSTHSAHDQHNARIPDVSADADPNTGVPIYDSWDFGTSTPWISGYRGGTSLACPLWAGMVAVADEGRAIAGQGSLDGPSQTLPELYTLPAADFHDITTTTQRTQTLQRPWPAAWQHLSRPEHRSHPLV